MQSVCLIEPCRSCSIQLVTCVQDVLVRILQPINIVVVDTLSQYIILCHLQILHANFQKPQVMTPLDRQVDNNQILHSMCTIVTTNDIPFIATHCRHRLGIQGSPHSHMDNR